MDVSYAGSVWKPVGAVTLVLRLDLSQIHDLGPSLALKLIAKSHRPSRESGRKQAQIGYRRRPGSYDGKPSVVVDKSLARQINVDAPNKAWVTGITYI